MKKWLIFALMAGALSADGGNPQLIWYEVTREILIKDTLSGQVWKEYVKDWHVYEVTFGQAFDECMEDPEADEGDCDDLRSPQYEIGDEDEWEDLEEDEERSSSNGNGRAEDDEYYEQRGLPLPPSKFEELNK